MTTVAVIVALNVIGAASRGKATVRPQQVTTLDQPSPASAAEAQIRPGHKPATRHPKKPLTATYAAPPLPSTISTVNLFQPQKRILDATGSPAINPNQPAPLPLNLQILARVDQVSADVSATGSPVTTAETFTVSPATPLPTRATSNKGHAKSRHHLHLAGKAATHGKSSIRLASLLTQPSAHAHKPARRSHLTRLDDPTPAEIVMRALRGPV